MRIPIELEEGIENEIKNIKLTELKEKANKLSDRYLNAKRNGQSLILDKLDVLAYSIMRMPATFCAINKALKETLRIYSTKISTVLDVGAGTGAGEWAILNNLDVDKIICIERDNYMKLLGERLLINERNILWKDQDIVNTEIHDNADLVITSYMINELKEEAKDRVINNILNSFNKISIFIEPGTPEGFKNIRKIQKIAIEKNLNILAPCTSQVECKLPIDDWCHSVVRVERNKVHKFLKNADVPYEDEKFSYIAISREKIDNKGSRILRHPSISTGYINVKLCINGDIQEKTITKKDKELFKKVKKLKCGDLII